MPDTKIVDFLTKIITLMTTEAKVNTLKGTIENLKLYIKKADHSQPVSQEFIINNLAIASTEKQEYLHKIANMIPSFQMLDYGNEEILSEFQLHEMLEDFENVLALIQA